MSESIRHNGGYWPDDPSTTFGACEDGSGRSLETSPTWASDAEIAEEDNRRFAQFFLASYQTPCGGVIFAIIRLGNVCYPEQWVLGTANTPPFPKDRWLVLENIGPFTSSQEMFEEMSQRPGWDLEEVEFHAYPTLLLGDQDGE